MILFVELSVDLRKGKAAKDGLYQYKNIAQNTNVGTIEVGDGTTAIFTRRKSLANAFYTRLFSSALLN